MSEVSILKTVPCKKRRKKKGQKKNARRRAREHILYPLSPAQPTWESRQKGKKKMPSTDVSNQTEQIFKGSEIL